MKQLGGEIHLSVSEIILILILMISKRIKELLNRNATGKLPNIKTDSFKSIYDWQYNDTILLDYNPLPSVKFEVAV